NLPKVNFGKFSEWRQKLIWRHSGRAVHGPLGSLSEDYSDRLLAAATGRRSPGRSPFDLR
ncbi:MAG: hypothetical protein V1797_04255, partial [Pseudomonadota bacterium]